MTAEIVNLHATIQTLKLNNKKVTPALFNQIDEGDFATDDTGWLGVEGSDGWKRPLN